ncbi:hypothetical protein M527_15165 [Sphingobium indicum IP26]|uniref:Uncharacterized protein n=1 Tax=Sphingobium indicum F2 TaxID=1450518 RepID=A0A8E0WQ69_9SPHN|nr:hypothetical protein M527_15165 [Sphingobium indicum IP26]KER35311.1 hypothetical protein AL00_17175 [Sphingobium indicum F2]
MRSLEKSLNFQFEHRRGLDRFLNPVMNWKWGFPVLRRRNLIANQNGEFSTSIAIARLMPCTRDHSDLAIDFYLLSWSRRARKMEASGGCGILMVATIENIY